MTSFKTFFSALILALIFTMCASPNQEQQEEQSAVQEVNVYTHRHYEPDQQLFSDFEEATGIKVNVVNASADELINKMEMEAEASAAY